MNKTFHTEEGISLMDIVKLLLSKIKLLILIVLAGGIVGGVFGVATSYNVDYYGTQIEFYVNPESPSDANGVKNDSQYGVYGAYGRHVMDNMVKLLNSESFAEMLMLNGETKTEAELEEWRKTPEYKSALRKHSSAVNFDYLKDNEDVDDANNLARSFIYVKISTLNDKKFAEELLQKVINVVPAYVEENMAIPSGYEGTNCQRITRSDDIALTNPGYTRSQAIKYALLLAAAAGVVACVVVILVDRSDKRLRDYEAVSKQFNVPILSVVPCIEATNDKKSEKSNAEVK